MANKIDWSSIIDEFFDAVGGKDNIQEYYICATRLRFILIDQNKVNKDKLLKLQYVKGYNLLDKENQLIFGIGIVNKIKNNLDLVFKKNTDDIDLKLTNKQPLWNKKLSFRTNISNNVKNGLSWFASIFVPLVPVFIIGGLSLALSSFTKSVGSGQVAQDFSYFFEIFGGAILGSLPAFVGYTLAKKMGGNPFFGFAVGLILVSPLLLNAWSNNSDYMLGIRLGLSQEEKNKLIEEYAKAHNINVDQVKTYYYIFGDFAKDIFRINLIGYQAQIIPTILAIVLCVYLEKGLTKITPNAIAIIVVPLFTVVITVWLTFWLIGPLGRYISEGISYVLTQTYKYTNYSGIGFGAMIFAFVYAPLVITGFHQGFLPIETQLLATTKYSFITPVASVSNVAQGMACLVGMIFIDKKSQKSAAGSGALSANLGITEPAMFGVNIQLRPLLLGGMIGSAIGGWWLGMTYTVSNSLGSASWIGLLQYDWITDNTIEFYKSHDIHAILQNIPSGVHIIIAMLLASLGTWVSSYLLLSTKWGKKSLLSYNDNNVSKYQKYLLNFNFAKNTK